MAEGRAGALGDYSTVAFSAGGVKQEISLEDWKGGWAAIVGGLNGAHKPAVQHGDIYPERAAQSGNLGPFYGKNDGKQRVAKEQLHGSTNCSAAFSVWPDAGMQCRYA